MLNFFSSNNDKEKSKKNTNGINEDNEKSFLDLILSSVKSNTNNENKIENLEENVPPSIKESEYVPSSIKESENVPPSIKESENVPPSIKESENVPPSIKESENVPPSIKESENVPPSIKESENVPPSIKESENVPPSIKESEKLDSINRIDFISKPEELEKPGFTNYKSSNIFSSIKNAVIKCSLFLSSFNFWFIFKILIIITIISILGLNIFLYLAEGTDFLQHIISKYAKFIPLGILNTMKMSALGIKGTANTAEINLNNLEENVKKNKAIYNEKIWNKKNKNLEKSLNKKKANSEEENNKKANSEEENSEEENSEEVNSEEENSEEVNSEEVNKKNKINQRKINNNYPKPFNHSGGKKRNGWCFIGNDRNGMPHCAKINDITMCNSGNISSSREICMNPLLRN